MRFASETLNNYRDFTDIELMAKKLKILIVEDDKKFGESLVRLLSNEGFECVHADKPQGALSACKIHSFDVALIDCMLPQMNGVELAMKIKEVSSGIVLYLMSGIYKDRNFSIAALKKTGAKSFLIKPFEMSELLSQMTEEQKNKKSPEATMTENAIKNLMLQENISQNVVLSALQSSPTINGYDLPFIVNSLLTYKTAVTLRIGRGDQEMDLTFVEGKHITISAASRDGAALRQTIATKGCVVAEDLQTLPDEKLSLAALINANLMSPHFAEVIEKETTVEMLNSFVNNQLVRLELVESKSKARKLHFEQKEVDDLIYNWVVNTSASWLKIHYMYYSNNFFKKLSTTHNKTQLFPIVMANKAAIALMMQNRSLGEILNDSKLDEETALRLVHLLSVYREFCIGSKKNLANYKAQIERLRTLLSSLEHQDYFERLGLTDKSSEQEIKKSYTDLSQTLHPDKLTDAPDELKALSMRVYEKIQDAYNNIKSPDRREQYLKQLENRRAEELQIANRVLENALSLLIRGDISAAEKSILEAQSLAPHSARAKVLQVWAGLKAKKLQPQQAVRLLATISNEERETAVFFHVKGLHHLALNEPEKAMMSFKNALAKDNNFMPSRRELSAVPQEKKNTNILTADLKQVVGLFFNRKK